MSTNHPRDDDHDFAQLADAFDRPVAPAPAFTARLRTQIQATEAPRGTVTPEPTPIAARQALATPHTRTPATGARRWTGARVLEAAAAMLLVSALALSAVFVYTLRDDDEPGPTNLAAFATPDATAMPVSNAQALARMNGPAWFFPDPAFDTTSFNLSPLFEDSRYSIMSMHASGNYLVLTGGFTDYEGGETHDSLLWVVDLNTGKVLWETREYILPNIAIANDTIYGIRVGANRNQPGATLVAMSLTTGERRFSGPVLPTAEGPEGEGFGPAVDGDTVYVADTSGKTFALEAATGEQLWVAEGEQRSTPTANGLTFTAGGSLVVAPDAIFVVTGDNAIRRLNPRDGSLIGEFDIAASIDLEISQITLYRAGNDLIARVAGFADTAFDGQVPMVPETIVSLDPATGDVRWSESFPEVAGNIAVTPDWIILPTRSSRPVPIDLTFVAIQDGSTRTVSPMADADRMSVSATDPDGETVLLLDSDNLLRVGVGMQSGDEGTRQQVMIHPFDRESNVTPAVVPGGKLCVASVEGRIYVLTPAE